MKNDWINIPHEKRMELKDFLLRLLTGGSAHNYLIRKLIQVLCELVRRSWVDDVRFHSVIDVAVGWMKEHESKGQLGLRVLSELVIEFDQCRTSYYDESTRRVS